MISAFYLSLMLIEVDIGLGFVKNAIQYMFSTTQLLITFYESVILPPNTSKLILASMNTQTHNLFTN